MSRDWLCDPVAGTAFVYLFNPGARAFVIARLNVGLHAGTTGAVAVAPLDLLLLSRRQNLVSLLHGPGFLAI